MFAKLYAGFGALILAGFMGATLSGWEYTTPAQQRLPAGAVGPNGGNGNMRQSPGGYRSFHFWHSGFHGGK